MKIALNGCGIAGPALAYWLHRFGHEPVLFEAAPAQRKGGYLIDFWGYGYDIAEKMGLRDGLHAQGYAVEHLRTLNARGRQTTHLDASTFSMLTAGRYMSIERSALAALVFEACGDVETRFSTSVIGFRQDRQGVDVTLSTGEERRFDLLIGTDGLHSKVRQLGFGPSAEFERDLGLRVGAFTLGGYQPRDELTFLSHSLPGRQLNRISLRDDKTLFMFITNRSYVDTLPTDEAGQKAALRHAFGDMRWEAPAALAGMDSVYDIYFDSLSQVVMPDWHNGRVAVLGDAAACASLLAGEGSSLAMLSAYVLAGELHRTDGDHHAAFVRWQAQIMPLVSAKQVAAKRFSSFFCPPNWRALWLRDMATRACTVPFLARKFIGPMFETDFKPDDYTQL
ncbi:MAG: FAD-binding domain [Rhodobacteraceae bacterium]|nr:FAD-binding domain [Paracoccaceae bacterium]